MTSKTSRKRKYTDEPTFIFKKGDFISHPTMGPMIIVNIRGTKIICKQFSKIPHSIKMHTYYVKHVENNWFISDRYMVKPLTIDEIQPWRQHLEPGSIVGFLFEGKTYNTMVIHRDGDFVTLQPIGCHFTYIRHIHSMSILSCHGHSDIYQLSHVFQNSDESIENRANQCSSRYDLFWRRRRHGRSPLKNFGGRSWEEDVGGIEGL